MTRKIVTMGTVAAFAMAAALVGAGDAGPAFACGDKAAKTAAATTSSSDCSRDAVKASTASVKTASCCAKEAKTTTAGNVHKAMIKSAMVAPGASPTINTAAFAAGVNGSMVAAGGGSCCDTKNAGATAASGACDKSAAVHTAGSGKSCDSAVKTAGASACSKSTKTAAAAVDAVPYRENKRVVLTGTYECGHCGVGATADCAPMFKTADGKVYPLWNSARVEDLRDDKKAKNVEIATMVKKIDGVKYLDVKSYKTL